ncbi:integral membrane protein-like protein [Corynespora cassiicola Philippines]|uniref:Integral membrane protein-like protein n=1 Tax=Corynespora cassiicola Philippines TaxID=1448308 RepID=A0A2T2N5X0_CORCC|nr:integral membrane protein-like protein [Corynespora cassiicola Philippines]
MRLLAVIPAITLVAALILSFLCLFAGHKKDFMEDYHLLTLNVSRLGENILNESRSSDNTLTNLLNEFTNDITSEINDAIGEVTEELGIDDFYSAHLLDYCYGQYTPVEAANGTVSQSDISKNVTGCSNQTAMFWFNPTEILERKLNESGVGVSLDDLNWPQDIQAGLDALRIVSVTSFVLYCIAIGLIFVSLVATAVAFFGSGRLSACLNFMLAFLAFLAVGIASGLMTAVVVKGSSVINEYGNQIGVQAHRGNKFLAITWAATALVFIAMCYWTVETCFPSGRRNNAAKAGKFGRPSKV